MELLRQVASAQFLYPAAAVVVVLLCAALVFVFGFRSAEQPQFDKLPIIADDRKSSSKKKKPKDKKSSPNRNNAESKSEPKKSPTKEKREEKVKEAEKPKVEKKEKVAEPKVKREVETKKGKKNKADTQKPEDFDDGLWEEVPKKSDKKKPKEDKKESPIKKAESPVKKVESPAKKNKKKVQEPDVEAAHIVEDAPAPLAQSVKIEVVSPGPDVDEEAARLLQAQVEEFQRALKAVELRDKGIVEEEESLAEESPAEELPEVKDLRSEKKKENKEKQVKKKEAAAKNAKTEEVSELIESESLDKENDVKNGPVFDELGDSWTETKAPKKGKKKARKD